MIVRTLGVIEHTKASTSENDVGEGTDRRDIPVVSIQDTSLSGLDTPFIPRLPSMQSSISDMGNLKLSSFDQFSPAPSQPPSPSSSRRDLDMYPSHQRSAPENSDDSERLLQSMPSSRRSESYVMLERDSELEKDGEELLLRRRNIPGAAGGSLND